MITERERERGRHCLYNLWYIIKIGQNCSSANIIIFIEYICKSNGYACILKFKRIEFNGKKSEAELEKTEGNI